MICPYCRAPVALSMLRDGPLVPYVPPSRQPNASWVVSCTACGEYSGPQRSTRHGAVDGWIRALRRDFVAALHHALEERRSRHSDALRAARARLKHARGYRDALRAVGAPARTQQRRHPSPSMRSVWLPPCPRCGALPLDEFVQLTDQTPGLGAIRRGHRVRCPGCGLSTVHPRRRIYAGRDDARAAWRRLSRRFDPEEDARVRQALDDRRCRPTNIVRYDVLSSSAARRAWGES